jgi:hypothetical protein
VEVNPDERKDTQEIEADAFAVELIYGCKNACYYDISNSSLVSQSHFYSERDNVNPAVVALNWAWYQEKSAIGKKEKGKVWAITATALKELEDQNIKASQIINNYLYQQLEWDSLGDDSQEFVERMAGIE